MRSLTRSIGAAAVLETAAETPPTNHFVSIKFKSQLNMRSWDDPQQSQVELLDLRSIRATEGLAEIRDLFRKRTQEVHYEAPIRFKIVCQHIFQTSFG